MEVLRRYTNRSDLLSDYARVQERVNQSPTSDNPDDNPELAVTGRNPRARLLSNRLTDADLQQLLSDYRSGVTGRELAARYNISRSSVKTILREHSARGKDQGKAA